MLKISRIIRTIAELFYKKKYSFGWRCKLVFSFLTLEFLVIIKAGKNKKKVTGKIAGFRVAAFSYASLLLLFKEIFVTEEYYSEINYTQPAILDCGANIGLATLYFKWRYPKAIINAFEPDEKTFQLLKENIAHNNLTGVYLHNKAISNYDGTITFYSDEATPGSLQMSTLPERMQKNKTEVACISLADFLASKKIDIAKIDIEGAEFIVLEDLDKTQAIHNIHEFFIEYHHKIENQKSKLSEFLRYFEKNNIEYQVSGTTGKFGEFQDFIIHARSAKN